MTVDTQTLRELHAAATPGEWKKVDKMPYLHAFPSGVSTSKHWEVPCIGRFDYGEGNLEFVAAAHNEMPALLDHIDAQANEIAEYAALCQRQSDLLSQTAIAIRGPEPALTRYSHADIPSRVKAVVGERDAQAAEIAALRQRWISVGDRLPETEEPVLIFTPSYPSCPISIDCWSMQHESPVGWSSATVETGMAWDDHEFEEVTHWMPLPAAPGAALSQEPSQ